MTSLRENEKIGIQVMDDFNEEVFDKRDKYITEKVVEICPVNKFLKVI